MYISGAKFEEHCCNTYISYTGDILDSVFYCLNVAIYDVITFLIFIIQKREYFRNKKDIPEIKTPFFLTLKSL